MSKTVFVLVTDEKYLYRAKKTIIDLRSTGQWYDDLVLICIDLPHVNPTFVDFYKITLKRFPPIQEKYELLKRLHYTNFSDTIDGREIQKPNQWEKLHVMDHWFQKWERVVFLDAGLRVLDSVHNSVLKLPYQGKFLAPDDGGNFVPLPNPNKLFKTQISQTYPKYTNELMDTFSTNLLEETYFLNCMWVYDTAILDICTKQEMIDGMLQYPICKTNEMALMNMFLHFKYSLWERFPVYALNGKVLFDWSENNNPKPSTWREYCFLKYPSTITFDDT